MKIVLTDRAKVLSERLYFPLIILLATLFGFFYGLGSLDILFILAISFVIMSFAGSGIMLKEIFYLKSNSIIKMIGLIVFIAPLLNLYVGKGIRYVLYKTGNSYDYLIYPEFVLLILTFCLILVMGKINVKCSIFFSMSNFWAMVILLTGGVLSSLFSMYPGESFKNTVFSFLIPFLLFISINIAGMGLKEMQTIVKAAIGAACIPLAFGWYEFYKNFGLLVSVNKWMYAKFDFIKIYSYQAVTFGNVGHTMDFILLFFPIAVYFLFKKDESIYSRMYMTSVLLLMLLNILIVFSRSGIITLLLTLLAAILFIVPGRIKLIAIPVTLGLPIIAGWMAGGALVERFKALISGDASTSERLQAIHTGMKIFEEHIITGAGTGVYHHYDQVLTAAHSLPVSLAAENGVLGLIGYLFILVTLAWTAFFLWKRSGKHSIGFELALWLSCVGFFFQGTIAGTNFSIMDVATWGMIFWAWQGMLVVRVRWMENKGSG